MWQGRHGPLWCNFFPGSWVFHGNGIHFRTCILFILCPDPEVWVVSGTVTEGWGRTQCKIVAFIALERPAIIMMMDSLKTPKHTDMTIHWKALEHFLMVR
jgi:hypothetical protein